MDWMPTMLSLAGVALPENRPLAGVDFSPLRLHGLPPAHPRPVLATRQLDGDA
jgi:arylsulfatase A-like enzyme